MMERFEPKCKVLRKIPMLVKFGRDFFLMLMLISQCIFALPLIKSGFQEMFLLIQQESKETILFCLFIISEMFDCFKDVKFEIISGYLYFRSHEMPLSC